MIAVGVRVLGAALLAQMACAGGGDAASTSADTTTGRGQPARASSTHDWTRFGWNAARTSASADPTGIDSANVGTMKRQQVAIDGTVDGSAIYLHGVQVRGAAHDALFVTTTYGKTLAIDANDGALLWRFTPPGYDSFAGSYRITNSTPVADPDRQFIYVAAPDGFVRKLAIADGHVAWSTSITQLPTREKIASPLNYDRGHVIATTGGYIGDAAPYQGHVAVLDAASGQLLHAWNSLCSDRAGVIAPESCAESGSAIWGRAGAVIDSATGDIFVATGNGRWDGATNWGDASIELDADATHIVGNYTPSNTDELNASDADVGSTSPVLLGGNLVAQGGKDGTIRLLDWTRMRGTTAHKGGETQSVSTPSGTDLFTAPAVLRTPTATRLFAADNGGTAAWTLSGSQLTLAWKNGHGGTSPVIAGGLLFVYDPGGGVRVYRPETGHEIAT
ncbi:MAG TPA: PQQ-binding-like beta-propeller repeat protein, partial [Gemmatimonadaceae bacterium]